MEKTSSHLINTSVRTDFSYFQSLASCRDASFALAQPWSPFAILEAKEGHYENEDEREGWRQSDVDKC
jgi:hypothetical protein